MPTSKKFFKKSENQLLIIKKLVYNICDFVRIYATVAQQVEQFTRNEQVASSNLASSSTYRTLEKSRVLVLSLPD